MMHTESNLYTPNGCTHTRKTLHIREKLGAPFRHVHLLLCGFLAQRERERERESGRGREGGMERERERQREN